MPCGWSGGSAPTPAPAPSCTWWPISAPPRPSWPGRPAASSTGCASTSRRRPAACCACPGAASAPRWRSPAMDEAEALQRLCQRHGVATGYHDVSGHWHHLAPDALAALLRDAGFLPPGTDAAAAEAAAERRAWLRALPPVQSLPAGGEPFSVLLRLPAATARIDWQVEEESGERHQGAVDAAALEIDAQ